MSEDLLFAKISEPDMTAVNFINHFRDRMCKTDRAHIEVFLKLWKLRPYNKTNGETTRVPRLRKEIEDWVNYKLLINSEYVARSRLRTTHSQVESIQNQRKKVGKILRFDGPVLFRQKCCRAAVHAICKCG